tara:strand:+ start:447 stop:623 length:177 start_codon:yes stop_codon:yes gene_type:complete
MSPKVKMWILIGLGWLLWSGAVGFVQGLLRYEGILGTIVTTVGMALIAGFVYQRFEGD